MAPALDHFAGCKNDDFVGVPDRRERGARW